MDLQLALVTDPTNIQCRVQLLDQTVPTDVRYSEKLQEAGIVIRPRQVVIVDRSHTPPELVWRVGTIATVERMDSETITYNDGSRPPVTVPFKDDRPQEERAITITVGDYLLISGHSMDALAMLDLVVDGRPAHPERLYSINPMIEEVYSVATVTQL